MKILLAPSETKSAGGEDIFKVNKLSFNIDREPLLSAYDNIVKNGDLEELSNLFGIKREKDILEQRSEYISQKSKKAIKRYTGVAFDYLDYPSLDSQEQNYIDNNVYIFSNLYGIVKASDNIPNYKLKQGGSVGEIKPEKFYKDLLKEPLDSALEDEDILDIRAGFYNKLYKPNKAYTTLKFLKNGKVVSHWAKAYRGLVLRHCAINKIDNIKDFIAMDIEQLQIKEIIESKTKQEIIYEISN